MPFVSAQCYTQSNVDMDLSASHCEDQRKSWVGNWGPDLP